jgi:PAS domain S-box-containing protein
MKLKISHRINLYVGGIVLVGVCVVIFNNALFLSRFMEDAGMDEAERLSKFVFVEIYAAMKHGGGRQENRKIIERLQKIEGIEEVRLIHGPPVDRQYGENEDEKPMDEFEREALEGANIRMIETGDHRVARFVMPLFVTEECTKCHNARVGEVNGVVSVRLSLRKSEALIASHKRNFFLLGVVLFSLTTGSLIFTVRKRLLGPLSKLERGTRALARGDFKSPVRIKTGDELEDVGRAFDSMAASLFMTTSYLRALYERYSTLVSMAADAIILQEVESKRVVEVNPAAEAITGYCRRELLNMKMDGLYPEEKLAEYRTRFNRWIQDGKGYYYDARIKKKNGTTVEVEIAASLVEFGGKSFLQEIWRDLSERRGFAETLKRHAAELEKKVKERTAELKMSFKEMERYKNELEDSYKRLKESEKTIVHSAKMASLGEMGAGIAHELNSPIAGILSITEVVMRRMRKTNPNYRLLEKSREAAVRTKYIIRDLLTYSNPSSEEMRPVLVNETVKSTLSLFLSEFKTSQIEIDENLEPALPQITGSKSQLMEVLFNIIRNAKDAIAGKGKITITTRTVYREKRGGWTAWVAIEIADSGPGIPDEIKDRIFDPFFTTKEKGGGLNIGLGLSICQGIVKAHRGLIEVECEAGKGSLFRVLLPPVHTHE